MFGCLRRIGCLVVLAVLIAGGWIFRDRWMPRVFGESRPVTTHWEPVTAEGGARARRAVESLGSKAGPVFVNLKPSELAGLLLSATGEHLPSSVQDAEVTIGGEQIHLRATVALDDIRGLDILGPFADFTGKRERIALAGTLDVVSPGLAEFQVASAQIGELPIPRAAIPKLLARLARDPRPDGVSPNGIPFKVPAYVGDVRVGKGKVTLYKNVT